MVLECPECGAEVVVPEDIDEVGMIVHCPECALELELRLTMRVGEKTGKLVYQRKEGKKGVEFSDAKPECPACGKQVSIPQALGEGEPYQCSNCRAEGATCFGLAPAPGEKEDWGE